MYELIDMAVFAYRNGQYEICIQMLSGIADAAPRNWMVWLYLAMSYEKVGRISDAYHLLVRMTTECEDTRLRDQAMSALPLVRAALKRRFGQTTKVEDSSSSTRPQSGSGG